MRRVWAIAGYSLTAAAMLAVAGWRIGLSEDRIRTGRRVKIEVRAYDPLDPLRGRYLELALPAFSPEAGKEAPDSGEGSDGSLFATLREDDEGFAELDRLSPFRPRTGEYLILRRDRDGTLIPPFDRFYVNQNEAAEADGLLRRTSPGERPYVLAFLKDGALTPTELWAGGKRFRAGSE